jgi:hypothetical protein
MRLVIHSTPPILLHISLILPLLCVEKGGGGGGNINKKGSKLLGMGAVVKTFFIVCVKI